GERDRERGHDDDEAAESVGCVVGVVAGLRGVLVEGGELGGAHAATSLMVGWVAKVAASAAVRASWVVCAAWMACQMAGAWWRPYWRMSSCAAAWRMAACVSGITAGHRLRGARGPHRRWS